MFVASAQCYFLTAFYPAAERVVRTHTNVHTILFNHASHTQHNNCTYVQTVDLQMGRDPIRLIDRDYSFMLIMIRR